MSTFLLDAGYVLDKQLGIWAKPDFKGIAYSDGDEVELRIEAAIRQATDICSLSDELERECKDWPSLYHLSKSRANILRPFESTLKGDILEIGAGCGAITRFLGECGGNVLALEGSPRRASIARQRTRDLTNVTVLADNFNNFRTNRQFDAITLIGVLEYSNLFMSGNNPTFQMLLRVKSLLKPGGRLFLAIENKLGLKYFAGAPEDHLGYAMYGLEGRYRHNEPQTFGRQSLTMLLQEAGFEQANFLAPFPDYKLPTSILSEASFHTDGFDAAVFAAQSVRRDPQLPAITTFSQELTWPAVVRNGLGMDLANSFLIVASDQQRTPTPNYALAWHYTTSRKSNFCKETLFEVDGQRIIVRYRPLSALAERDSALVQMHILPACEYSQGTPLADDLVRIVARDGWAIEEVASFLAKYLEILVARSPLNAGGKSDIGIDTLFPGVYFDRIPQNIIKRDDGSIEFIDEEWIAKEAVDAGYLVFRSLANLASSISRFGEPQSLAPLTPYELIHATMQSLGWKVTRERLEAYTKREAEIQELILDRTGKFEQIWSWLTQTQLVTENLVVQRARFERENNALRLQVANLSREVESHRENLENLEKELVRHKEDVAASKEGAAAWALRAEQLQSEVEGLYRSASWKITAPARAAARAYRRAKRVWKLVPEIFAKGGGLTHTCRKAWQVIHTEGIEGVRGRLRILERIKTNSEMPPPEEAGEESTFKFDVVPYYVDPQLDTSTPNPIIGNAIGVHLYLHDPHFIQEVAAYLANIPCAFDLYVSIPANEDHRTLQQHFARVLPLAQKITVKSVALVGMDLAPLIVQFGKSLTDYDIVGHFYTSPPRDTAYADSGCHLILDDLLGTAGSGGGRINHFIELLNTPTTKLVFAQSENTLIRTQTGVLDFPLLHKWMLEQNSPIALKDLGGTYFPEASMFWGRASALRSLLSLPLTDGDLPPENSAPNNTLRRSLNQLLFLLAEEDSGQFKQVMRGDSIKTYVDYESRQDFRPAIVHTDIKVLAFYLPQFHPTPENDEWHGKGFTEWTKVRAANPLFEGHYQQHIPHPDIGYYLLDSPETLKNQAGLMKTAGVSGLVFYHYWFGGQMILEKPAQMLLANPDIDMPYCFCWANENWTRRWDGNENDILLGQDYSEADAKAFIKYLFPYFRDPRYLKVEGRPLLMVYRPSHITDAKMYVDVWREECEAAGLPSPYIVAVLTRGTTDPRVAGMDAGVERVLHDWTGGAVPDLKHRLRSYGPINGSVLAYKDVAEFYSSQNERKDFTYFRSIVPIWDNTARYGQDAYVVHGSTPALYQLWLENIIEYSRENLPEDRRFIFVNAWNEWAEGAHLEPDTRYGYAYLNATGRALAALPYGSIPKIPEQPHSWHVHITFSDDFRSQITADPSLRQRFFYSLKRSSLFENHVITMDADMRCEGTEVSSGKSDGAEQADFVIEFGRVALCTRAALEHLLNTCSQHPESLVIPNFYDSESDLVTVAENSSVDPSVTMRSPIRAYKTGCEMRDRKGVRMSTQAACFVTGPSSMEASANAEVTTIIRIHSAANFALFEQAICCLAAMHSCTCVPLIAAQDLSPEQLGSVRTLIDNYAWKGSTGPEIQEFKSTDAINDLRSRMMNEALRSVQTRYVGFLDYDDLLMPHAYEWLLGRLRSTNKAVAFGRVYATTYLNTTNTRLKRTRSFEYGYTYKDFLMHNHAPLHSFLIDLQKVDLDSIIYHDDQRYMEDYFLTMQIFSEENCDWESLSHNKYIGDYLHSIDRSHTLAFSSDRERQAILQDPTYLKCSGRVAQLREKLLGSIET